MVARQLNGNMTGGQGAYLRRLVGVNSVELVESKSVGKQQASDWIESALNGGREQVRQAMIEAGAIPAEDARPQPQQNFTLIWDEAHGAGMIAAEAATPMPMIVQQHANQMDDSSPVERVWVVESGVCGFAWITVLDGRTPFARWCRKNKGTRKGYPKGEKIWVHEFGQSYERKQAYAGAFAEVLKSHGIEAYAGGRLD